MGVRFHHVFVHFQSLEQVLNSRSEQFERKVESLIEAWKQVYHYSSAVKDLYFVQLMDWAKFHTLNLVLNGDWKNYKGDPCPF